MSDVLTFQQENEIRDDKIVNGYARSLSDSANINIPIDIVNLCIEYYHIKIDAFDSNKLGIYHTLSGNVIRHSVHTRGYSTSLLRNMIESGKHVWKFKIKNYLGYIQIGIWKTTDTHKSISRQWFTFGYMGYGYKVNIARIEPGSARYGARCSKNDIVSMYVDMDELTLRFAINEKDQGIAFMNIDQRRYLAAVMTCEQNDSVELIYYDQLS